MKVIFALYLSAGMLQAAATTYTSLPYRSRVDSPFAASITNGTTLVEDFEDGLLNTPGLSLPVGRVSNPLRNSVDADDGVMDNLGIGYHWQTGGFLLPGESEYTTEIRFELDFQNRYPTHAGLVFLGLAPTDLGYFRFFKAYDAAGLLIAESLLSAPLPVYQNINTSFSTLGDRFFGLIHGGGISKILVGGSRFDHIQFGYGPIPEPGSAALVLCSALHLATRRRKTPGGV